MARKYRYTVTIMGSGFYNSQGQKLTIEELRAYELTYRFIERKDFPLDSLEVQGSTQRECNEQVGEFLSRFRSHPSYYGVYVVTGGKI